MCSNVQHFLCVNSLGQMKLVKALGNSSRSRILEIRVDVYSLVFSLNRCFLTTAFVRLFRSMVMMMMMNERSTLKFSVCIPFSISFQRFFVIKKWKYSKESLRRKIKTLWLVRCLYPILSSCNFTPFLAVLKCISLFSSWNFNSQPSLFRSQRKQVAEEKNCIYKKRRNDGVLSALATLDEYTRKQTISILSFNYYQWALRERMRTLHCFAVWTLAIYSSSPCFSSLALCECRRFFCVFSTCFVCSLWFFYCNSPTLIVLFWRSSHCLYTTMICWFFSSFSRKITILNIDVCWDICSSKCIYDWDSK